MRARKGGQSFGLLLPSSEPREKMGARWKSDGPGIEQSLRQIFICMMRKCTIETSDFALSLGPFTTTLTLGGKKRRKKIDERGTCGAQKFFLAFGIFTYSWAVFSPYPPFLVGCCCVEERKIRRRSFFPPPPLTQPIKY